MKRAAFMIMAVWTCLAQDPVAELEKAVAASPQRAQPRVKLAALLEQRREHARAVTVLRRALELEPDLPEAHGLLGQALLAQGYSAEAIPHLQLGRRKDLAGIALAEEHRATLAVAQLVAALEAKPDDPDLLYFLGKASAQLLQRSFDELMRTGPGSARAHQLLAETYLNQRQIEASEKEYRKALEIRPDLRGIHLAIGRMKLDAGSLDEAEREFRAEAALSPGDGETAWLLGAVLLKKGRNREALAELRRSDRLRPQMMETLLDLGKAYSLENEAAEAEKAWLGVIAIDDNNETASAAHFQLAQLYRRQGKIADADRQLQRFQQLQSTAPRRQ